MIRSILVVAFVALTLSLVISADDATDDAVTDDAAADLTVGGKEAQEAFEAGKSAFESSDFKAAEKSFKESRKTAEKKGKQVLERWLDACKGGKKLVKVEKAMNKGDWRLAYRQLQGLSAKYGDTPLKPRLEEMLEGVSEELFMMLATFEKDPPDPEKEAGSGGGGRTQTSFNTNKDYVREGERSLKWQANVDPTKGRMFDFLQVARFETGTLMDYKVLHLSIFNPDAMVGKFTLVFDVGNLEELAGGDPLKAKILFKHITVQKPGWMDLDIDIHKGIQTLTNCERSEVEGISLMMVPPSRPKTIYLDDVRFEK